MRQNLGLHPEVHTAPQEVKFFNHPKRLEQLGLDWYREQFSGWQGEPIVGEATPGYLMWWHRPIEVAARIDRLLPGVRIIALLRDPVDRAQSALAHHVRQERIRPGTRLVDWVRRQPPDQDWLGIVSGGWYAASLEPYVRIFGDRLQVVLYDDVLADPEVTYRRALDHVGASDGHLPDSFADVVGRGGSSTPLVPVLSDEDRVDLYGLFAADVDHLEDLIDRDLTPWRPGT